MLFNNRGHVLSYVGLGSQMFKQSKGGRCWTEPAEDHLQKENFKSSELEQRLFAF